MQKSSNETSVNIPFYDVVVVGGGMIGASTALAIAELGLTVAVIENKTSEAFHPAQAYDLRVSAISKASEILLTQLGAWQQLTQWRLCPYQRLGVWEVPSAYTEFNSHDIDEPHLGHIVENRLLQLSLWQQVTQKENIQLFCPEQLINFTVNEQGVEVQLSKQQLKTQLIVAADGANSQVRDIAHIGLTGWNYQQAAMLIHVETEAEQQNITWQQFLPAGPVAMLPLSGKNASLVWYHRPDEIKRLASLPNQQLTEQIHQHFPERLGKVTVLNKAFFPLTRRHANQYIKERVVLVGDAAHTINPLAGQGVNLGFKDVKALQLAMAEAIGNNQSWSSFNTLKHYEKARRADNLLMMSTMDILYTSFSHPSPIVKGLRNLAVFTAGKAPILKDKMLTYACGLS